MNCHLHLALYRRLATCYPRTFRLEYGEDLTATFELQLREHGPSRCWLRTVQDLIITVPIQHLESRMKHPTSSHITSSHITTTCLALAIAGTLAAIVTGTGLYAVILLLVAFLAVAIAAISRKATKPALALDTSAKWKKFMAADIALLAIIIVLLNVPPNNTQELSTWAWSLMMGSMLLSFTLIGAGVVLGVARLSNNRHQ